jgi:Transmembrane family 220, helix
MENRSHSVIAGILGLIFVAFAVLQFNDPDPFTWISVYGLMVVLVSVNIWRRLPMMVSFLPMVMALIGAYWLWPDSYMGLSGKMASRPGVELARESLGLCICACACAYVLWRSWVRRPRHPWES